MRFDPDEEIASLGDVAFYLGIGKEQLGNALRRGYMPWTTLPLGKKDGRVWSSTRGKLFAWCVENKRWCHDMQRLAEKSLAKGAEEKVEADRIEQVIRPVKVYACHYTVKKKSSHLMPLKSELFVKARNLSEACTLAEIAMTKMEKSFGKTAELEMGDVEYHAECEQEQKT